MKIEQLNNNDYIWFRASTNSQSFYGKVLELIYNDGEPQAVVEMGEYTKVIDDTYDIAIGSGYDGTSS